MTREKNNPFLEKVEGLLRLKWICSVAGFLCIASELVDLFYIFFRIYILRIHLRIFRAVAWSTEIYSNNNNSKELTTISHILKSVYLCGDVCNLFPHPLQLKTIENVKYGIGEQAKYNRPNNNHHKYSWRYMVFYCNCIYSFVCSLPWCVRVCVFVSVYFWFLFLSFAKRVKWRKTLHWIPVSYYYALIGKRRNGC